MQTKSLNCSSVKKGQPDNVIFPFQCEFKNLPPPHRPNFLSIIHHFLQEATTSLAAMTGFSMIWDCDSFFTENGGGGMAKTKIIEEENISPLVTHF